MDCPRLLLVKLQPEVLLQALLALGGVFIGLYLEWNVVELSAYAILASFFAFGGGIVGGWLDGLVGPKRALMIEITGMIATLAFQLSITPNSILYGLVPGFEIWDGPIFNTLSDVVYLSTAVFIAVTATAMQWKVPAEALTYGRSYSVEINLPGSTRKSDTIKFFIKDRSWRDRKDHEVLEISKHAKEKEINTHDVIPHDL